MVGLTAVAAAAATRAAVAAASLTTTAAAAAAADTSPCQLTPWGGEGGCCVGQRAQGP